MVVVELGYKLSPLKRWGYSSISIKWNTEDRMEYPL